MNLYGILLIVYFFEEYGCTLNVEYTSPYFTVGNESPDELKQLELVNEELLLNILYRYQKEEFARIKARDRINEFENLTSTYFAEIKKPPKQKRTKRLWKRAKRALDKYNKIKSRFEHEKFCDPPMADGVCIKAFRDPFFEKKKLTYASNSVSDNKCVKERYLLKLDEKIVDLMLAYRPCLAKKRNYDGTEILFNVYLQSAYLQPLIGKHRFFVIIPYFKNLITEQWNIPSNKKEEKDEEFRYEAYLLLS